METPSSARRMTRAAMSRMLEDSEKVLSKSRQRNQEQHAAKALLDITNDSPIVGLAAGSLETPLSSISKQRSSRAKRTPGSGEALLRGQVKTLLEKVEEEAVLSKLSKLSKGHGILNLPDVVRSPIGLLAPTPANTPQVLNLSSDGTSSHNSSVTPSATVVITQEGSDNFDQEKHDTADPINRSLLLDFSEKSEISDASECSSVLILEEGLGGERGAESKQKKSFDDDDHDVSNWSTQASVFSSSASNPDEDEEELTEEGEEYDEEEDDGGCLVDELCEAITRISVNDGVKFAGKHTRFVYDSDDELIDEVIADNKADACVPSPNIVRLKGLPTPIGKHLRFPQEDEEVDG